MTELWLVDGYNLLYELEKSGAFGKRTTRGALKELLFARLASFAAMEKRQVTVILDGTGPTEELKPYQTSHFYVEYSKKISADAVIEHRLYENRGKVSMVVVTQDRAVIDMARGNGARTLGCAQVLELLRESEKESAEAGFRANVRAHGFHRPFSDRLDKFDRP